MPYIKQEVRDAINRLDGFKYWPHTSGELNYVLTCACESYLSDKKLSYTTINDIIGALECAKIEFYRRIAAPYEDKKIDENGDIYPEELL